jgi:ATP-binding cassette, subfamily B, bacterial HlyB/CyaB
MTEQVAASETLKSLQLENNAGRRFAEINQAYLSATLHTRELGNGYSSFMQVTEQLMNAAVLCLGAYFAMTNAGLTIGMLVAFQMFASKVSQPLLKLSGYWQELQQVRTAVAQLGDVMNTPTERYSPLASSVAAGRGRLQVESLGFRYAEDRPPLYEGFNCTVEPGEVVLITGPSGCGKSTLAKILQGLYANYSGNVKVDGRDTRSMSINELRANFGVVPQEAVLFAGTILDNLLMGAPNATLEQAVQACQMAGIHETIENLPNGYQTVIGERGIGLSGGQRQRVAIARALLKRPRILVFDESTSGLDTASAERVAQTVNALRGKVSMLFIAHKVPTSLKVDRHVQLQPSTELPVTPVGATRTEA